MIGGSEARRRCCWTTGRRRRRTEEASSRFPPPSGPGFPPPAPKMASALEQFVNSVRQLSAQGEQPGGSGGPGLDGLPLRRHPGPGLTWRAERSGWAALEASACLPDCRVSPAFIPLWGALRVPPQGAKTRRPAQRCPVDPGPLLLRVLELPVGRLRRLGRRQGPDAALRASPLPDFPPHHHHHPATW